SMKIINPNTLVRSIKIKKIFNQLKGSPKNNISATTVPPAPNPTNTVYTVVVGSICATLISKTFLTIIKMTVSVHVKKLDELATLITHNTSKKDAKNRVNQYSFIVTPNKRERPEKTDMSFSQSCLLP